jgi:hypothetical protein
MNKDAMAMETLNEKVILDACCGPRMFWFTKEHPKVLYQDIREEAQGYILSRPSYEVRPDIRADFKNMPYPNKSFKMVVFDPPHLFNGGETGWQVQKYGLLNKKTWKDDIRQGFIECWRVLDDYGTLVFKWNEEQVGIRQVLELFPERPLFGHPTARSGKTKWCVFMKFPEKEGGSE